jgi:hypothetical protein
MLISELTVLSGPDSSPMPPQASPALEQKVSLRPHTPLGVVALVSRGVTRIVDQVTGDRGDCPLLVAAACVEALAQFQIAARIYYGQAAWIEVLEDHSVVWAGCWGGQNEHFWVSTAYGEVIDLNTSIAHRKRSPLHPQLKALYSPPILWSVEVPRFYRYRPEGVAEIELHDERDQKHYERVLRDVRAYCAGVQVSDQEADWEFPNEPILVPDRRLLDDSQQTFQHFERAVAVRGIPPLPF